MTDIKPLVDVVIPVHGRLDLLIQCLDSIKNLDRVGNIIVMDDASPREEADRIKELSGVKVYQNVGTPNGFIASVNRGVKKSTAPYILILNSDTRAASGQPIRTMAEDLDMGYAIVGAKLVFPQGHQMAGTVQCYSIGYTIHGYPYHPFMNMNGDEPCVLIKREVNAVTGACLMIKREWWDKVGGMDTRFGMGVHDDSDLCLSVRGAGGVILADPDAVFFHWQHGSQTQTTNWFTRENIDKNLSLLYLKHGQPPCDDFIYYNMIGKRV